jgi:hypothetical protein
LAQADAQPRDMVAGRRGFLHELFLERVCTPSFSCLSQGLYS